MKEYYLTNKICGLFTSKSERERMQDLERQRLIASISNKVNFEIEREVKEMNKRLQSYVHHIVESELSVKREDEFCSYF